MRKKTIEGLLAERYQRLLQRHPELPGKSIDAAFAMLIETIGEAAHELSMRKTYQLWRQALHENLADVICICQSIMENENRSSI